MDKLNRALQKGVPNTVVLPIAITDLKNLCVNPQLAESMLGKQFINYINIAATMIGKSLIFYHTNRALEVKTDVTTFTKTVSVSKDVIINMLSISLDKDDIDKKVYSTSFDDLCFDDKTIEERLARLQQIKKESALQRKFPNLYKSYEEFVGAKAEFEYARRNGIFKVLEFARHKNLGQLELNMFDEVKTFKDFISYTHSALSSLHKQEEQILEAAKDTQIDMRSLGIRSASRLELFLADTYARIATYPGTDMETKQKCAYYLSTYMFEQLPNLDDGIKIDRLTYTSEGRANLVISKRTVYERFRKLLVDNPELFNVNMDSHIFNGMPQQEIDALMASYLETLKLQWDIIPDGISLPLPEEEKEENKLQSRTKTKVSKQDPLELFYQKKTFFDQSEPLLRVMGKDTFDGYVGYIYPNGQVVLDQYYENSSKKRLAQDVAIYSMGIDDFYRLSHLSKSDIIRNRLCKRFYHRGDWQSKVRGEITGDVMTDMNDKINVLRSLTTAKM